MKPSDRFTLILTWHCDPGHEWLEVSASLVDQLGILDKLSEYSYYSHDQQKYYLEGDCDAAILVEALKLNQFEIVFRFQEHRGDAPMRRMARVGSDD